MVPYFFLNLFSTESVDTVPLRNPDPESGKILWKKFNFEFKKATVPVLFSLFLLYGLLQAFFIEGDPHSIRDT